MPSRRAEPQEKEGLHEFIKGLQAQEKERTNQEKEVVALRQELELLTSGRHLPVREAVASWLSLLRAPGAG